MRDDEVEQLLRELQPVVRRIAQRFFADPSLVEEALQEHALAVWQARRKLDDQHGARPWAIRAMDYACLTIRKRQLIRQVPQESLEEAHESKAVTVDETGHLRDLAVRQAFDKLPSHLWIVAWLVHGEGFLVSETAQRLGLPRLLTEQRLQEATVRLQGLLKDWR